jgi:subfamily B ATP-binding cassette protein MsbA
VNGEIHLITEATRRHAGVIAATLVLSLLAAIAEGFSIGLLIPFLQTFSDDSSSFATGFRWVDVHLLGVEATQLGRLVRICILILIATWLRSLFGYLSGLYSVKARAYLMRDFRLQVVDQLRSVAPRFFAKAQGGEMINTITNELSRLTTSVGVVFNVVTQGTMFLMYGVIMIWISWELSLIVLVVFGVLSLGLTRLIRSVRHHGAEITRANGQLLSRITEFISGIRTVTLYNQQDFERGRLNTRINDLMETVIATTKRSMMVQPISQAIVGTLLIGVVFFAVWILVLPGKLDLAFLLAFLFALFRLMPTVHRLNQQRGEWAANREGLSNMHALLRTDDKPYLPEGKRQAASLEKAITFDHVDFSYEPGEPVLHDVCVQIERGKTTALVGGSGAGKSTLVDLIPRLYDPDRGAIRYDGVDIQEFTLASLRSQMAVVSQSTFIFNDTVRANIAYGRPDATETEIRTAAEQANATDFIREMSDGFDTLLGDRGIRVSGGQRQRIAIARAILQDPEILILDEATSSLDSISEQLVQESLERLMAGRTVIAIAHRLSTIENADWVVVLEDGRVVEQGPYDALLQKREHLWSYHSIQFQSA